ncbi:MAG: glycosyltransferase family 2 protein [Nitrospirae bacterium]|nr:glycosyltransferase family 2 protein [Nitrospirota bacterium]
MLLVSIIIPVLNEEDNLKALYERLCAIEENPEYAFEFIFVDDGSTDDTVNILAELSTLNPKVKILRLSRNFGSHAACLAGLMNAKGDACIFMSADMQEPPEMIRQLISQWKNGYEVVMGLREGKVGLFSRLYYFLVRRFALKNMPESGTDVFLIDRKVAAAVSGMREKNTSIFGLILWSGFKQLFIPYNREKRKAGVSKWTLGKKIKLFVDTFVSFSYFPIRLISIIGILFALIGFIYASIVVFNRLFFYETIEGWTSLMVVLLVVSGVQMLMFGILGEYLWRNFDESRKRPPFIISERIGFDIAQK